MADKTSTLSVEVRTGQAVAELAKLKEGLTSVALAANAIGRTQVVPPSVSQETRAATKSINQYSSAMDMLEKSSTTTAGVQLRVSRSFGQVRAATKLAQDATLVQVREFNQKMDATEFAAEARRIDQMRGAQAKYLSLLGDRQKIEDLAAGRRQATHARQLTLDKAYFERDVAQRIAYLAKVERVMQSGALSTSQVARNYGVTALRELAGGARVGYATTLAAAKEASDTRKLGEAHKHLGNAAKDSTGILRGHSAAMRDAHGVARGLSGALGTLWMTYGAIAPLIAGAAVGSMVKSTLSVGKDLEYRLKFLEALGNDPVSTNQMMPSVLGSMKTPLEAAEAMQALAQAGLTSRQALEALNTVMQLSTLGELGMSDAAVTVTAALSAFNLQTSEAGRVGDVFAKAAAVSNTSVQKITESMKQASTSAAQYGITIEETSAALAVMAQRNITGTMAGTSFRNMTKELYTPIARGAKAMEQLGLTAYESTGRMKPFQQVLADLRESLFGLDEKSKNSALEAIFGERGSRAIKPILEDLDNYISKVKEMEGAQGFLVIANAKLINTVEGASNRLQSTIQQTYAKSFTNIQDSLRDLLDQVEKIAGSEGFTKLVAGTAQVFIEASQSILQNKDAILQLATVYAVAKGATLGLNLIMGAKNTLSRAATAATLTETVAVTANTQALQANTGARALNQAATSGALSRVFTSMGGLVGVATKLTSAIGWVALGYTALGAIYDTVTNKAEGLAKTQDREKKRLFGITEELEKQYNIQVDLNRKRAGGVTITDNRTEQERVFEDFGQKISALTAERDLEAGIAATMGFQLEVAKQNKGLLDSKSKSLEHQVLLYGDQARFTRDLQTMEGERANKLATVLSLNHQIAETTERQARAMAAINGLIEQQKRSEVIGAAEGAAARYQRMINDKKEAEAILRVSTDPEKIKVARGTIKAADKHMIADPLGAKGAALKGGEDAIKIFEDQAQDASIRYQEEINGLLKSVTFNAPKTPKGPKDYNDPNYILERLNAQAAKTSLKETGDLRKANLATMREQAKAQDRIREQYLTEDVIAGLRAREKAEENFNQILDKREALLLDLKAAREAATDPKQRALATKRIAATQSDIDSINAARRLTGKEAYDFGVTQYLEDNTASAGIEKLFAKYRNEAMKTGDIVANALEGSFDIAGKALEDFVVTGKFNFKGFTVDVLQNLAKMSMQMATNSLFSMVAKVAGSALNAWGGGGNDIAGAASSMNAQAFAVSAKGNVFSAGNMHRFAKGGAFTNRVTTGTNVAPMSMFGEAGPEAIMPLTRTSGGDLGVKVVPSGYDQSGGNVFHITTSIQVSADGTAKTETTSNNNQLLAQFGSQISSMVKSTIQKELSQGGLINRAIKQA